MTYRAVLAVLTFTLLQASAGDIWSGGFFGVLDGETIAGQDATRPVKITLERLDYPKRRQSIGIQAKQITSDPVSGKELKKHESQEAEKAGSPREPIRWITGKDVFIFLAGFLLGIAGIVATLWTYLKSKRERRPGYVVKSLPVVQLEAYSWQDLRLKANDELIGQLTLSKIALWNAGKQPIEAGDVLDPIILSLSQGNRLVQWKMLHGADPTNNVSIHKEESDGGKLEIRFDILDHDDGIVLLIAHTGQGNDDIRISGKIKTVKKLWRIDIPDPKIQFRDRIRNPIFLLADFLGLLWGLAFIAFIFYSPDTMRFFFDAGWFGFVWLMVLGAGGAMVALVLGLLVGSLVFLPVRGMPRLIKTAFKPKF